MRWKLVFVLAGGLAACSAPPQATDLGVADLGAAPDLSVAAVADLSAAVVDLAGADLAAADLSTRDLTTLPDEGRGQQCTRGDECATGFCAGSVCCDSACTGACQACTLALTGVGDGTCAAVHDGLLDPNGVCATTPASGCGSDGKCAGGACRDWPANTTCIGAQCASGVLTRASKCDGNGSCVTPQPGACPGGVICADNTSCKPSCGNDNDCVSPSTTWCSAGSCVSKSSVGTCGGNDQCTSNACGPGGSGNCCASATCTGGGACGATGCDVASGACQYPGLGNGCGTITCTGSTLTPAGHCDGSGGCTPGTPGPCGGKLACSGDGITCKGNCTGDNDCASPSTEYCVNPGPNATCADKLGFGACGGDNQCTSGHCGLAGSGNCCNTTCTTGGSCGATGCDGASGACVYPDATTTCGGVQCNDGNMLTGLGACDSSGGCTPATAQPCTGGFNCASSTTCLGACGSDGDCASPTTTYCANPGVNGTCAGRGDTGATCSADDQCLSSSCCDSPPASTCADADTLTVYTNAGCKSASSACSYSSGPQHCDNGCSNDACNGTPGFAGAATGTSLAGAVTFDVEGGTTASTGVAPPASDVTVTITTTPSNGFSGLTLTWTNDNFTSTTPVSMTLGTQAAGIDTWTATVPAQSAGTTVRFSIMATEWDGTTTQTSPSSGFYTYDSTGLTISVTGGVGTVTSTTPVGIACTQGNGGTCGMNLADGTPVTLDAGSTFKSWGSGPCSGTLTSTCSFNFNGSDGTQQVAFYSALSFAGAPGATAQDSGSSRVKYGFLQNLTVEAWSNLLDTTATEGAHIALVSNGQPLQNANGGIQLGWVVTGGKFYPELWVTMVGYSGSSNPTFSCVSTTAVNGNEVHHVAGDFTGFSSGTYPTMHVWLDGTEVCSKSIVYAPPDAANGLVANFSAAFLVGPVNASDTNPFAGAIDELRLSNAIVYTSAFTPAFHPTASASTIGLYHFDEGTGTTAKDSIGTAQNPEADLTLTPKSGSSALPAWVTEPQD